MGVVVRVLAVASAALLLCCVAVLLVLASQIRRGSQLLKEVQDINLGDSEDSIRPILERFGGHRWDVQLDCHEDYNYVLKINPWGFPALSGGKSRGIFHAFEIVLNPRFRRAIGFRRWLIDSEIAIKQHRVVAVQTTTIVEGRRMWLGAMWRHSEKPREFERNAESVDSSDAETKQLATPGNLNMESGTGTSWSIWTTPSSPKDHRRMANQLNFGCLRSLSGCDSVCDLMPEAAKFFSKHPELAPKGGGWDDSSRTCIKHYAAEDWYW